MKLKALLMSAVAVTALAVPAVAQEVTLRMQTHYATEHPTGKLLAAFIDNVGRRNLDRNVLFVVGGCDR